MSSEARPCESIVAEFVFGPMRCNQPSTTEAIDATWGSTHPVCAEHAPTTPDEGTDPMTSHEEGER